MSAGANITRRRFLALSATIAGAGGLVYATSRPQTARWSGYALGAEAAIELTGPTDMTGPALEAAVAMLRTVEEEFSIYDPASTINRFNQDGIVAFGPEFERLAAAVDEAHAHSGGLFDPTIQAAFAAKLRQQPSVSPAGWASLMRSPSTLRATKPGTELTFNGIAQGYACDRVVETLVGFGAADLFVNTGEWRAVGPARALSVRASGVDEIAKWSLANGAVATTAWDGYVLPDGTGHVIHPSAKTASAPFWDTVSVRADTATMADAISTALILTPDASQLNAVADAMGARAVVARAIDGRLYRNRSWL